LRDEKRDRQVHGFLSAMKNPGQNAVLIVDAVEL
jgi:hypothetical protein